jgi:adenine deaminase
MVNVYSGQIQPADILICGNQIAGAMAPKRAPAPRLELIEAEGSFALPGFVEPHMHIETTFLSPRQLARAIVPLGTTTLFVDGTDVSYIAGTRSVRALIDGTKELPMHVFLEAPSYSAYLPGLQTTGGDMKLGDVQSMLSWPETVSLGEVVAAKVISRDEEYLAKICAYQDSGKRINGHTAEASPSQLDAFVAAGIIDDHTCLSTEDLDNRLRRGVTCFLVEAPGRRNCRKFVRHILDNSIDTRNLCFCIDNTSVAEIVGEDYGYLDYLVTIAVQEGMPAVQAIQMATLNAAQYYKQDRLIGSLGPGRLADIQLLDNLVSFRPHTVLFGGQVVARDGRLLETPLPHDFPEWFLHSVRLHPSFSEVSLALPANSGRIRAMSLLGPGNQADNLDVALLLPVRDGMMEPDLTQDVVKICVIERYGLNGNVGIGFIQGTGLQRGAIGSSMSISDSNLVIIGCEDQSICRAAQALQEIDGGFVAVDGDEILGVLPLPVAGQMSDAPFEQTLAGLNSLVDKARSLGCTLNNPFFSIASTVLMSVPDLGMSDRGYIDARTGKLLPTLLKE